MEWVLVILSFVFVLAVVLPFVRSDYWTFRILEYPRLQKLAIGFLLAALTIVFKEALSEKFWWVLIPNLLCCVYLCTKIYPYTIFSKKEMRRVKAFQPRQSVSLLTANVLQENRKFENLLRLVQETKPDIVFLLETDSGWAIAMQELETDYSYTLKMPLSNTYGLLFYSRLPLRNQKILFRVDKEVPSIQAEAQLPCGEWVQLYGLHPKPPVPHESLRSTAKDKELMLVAFEVEKLSAPSIVLGDLNDVAWSHTTELFRKVSRLLDPRRGRGFYSTFSAHHWWVRFPLDYIFCSSDFGLVSMKRLPRYGSDHFAMYIQLQYEPRLDAKHTEPSASAEERSDAKEKTTTPAV